MKDNLDRCVIMEILRNVKRRSHREDQELERKRLIEELRLRSKNTERINTKKFC